MIELKITGNDANELFVKAAQTLGLLVQGGQALAAQQMKANAPTAPAAPADDRPPQTENLADDVQPPCDVEPATLEAVPEANPKAVDFPADELDSAKTRKPRASRAKAATVETAPAAPAAEPEQTYTIDDIRNRMRNILAEHQKRGHDMPAVTTYAKGLLAKFDVKSAAEIPAERYGEFMAASQAYLDGTAT